MSRFCVNKNAQSTGEHEVHNLDNNCSYLPAIENQLQLGSFNSCHVAITEAKKTYSDVDGCKYYAPDCHTR